MTHDDDVSRALQETFKELEHYSPRAHALLRVGESLITKSPERAGVTLKSALSTLRQRQENVMHRANDRKRKLEEALTNAKAFSADMEAFKKWLSEKEKSLHHWKPVSRVLDTVTDQIETHKVSACVTAARRRFFSRAP